MDAETFKYFSTLGIGGILAGFMFVFYRKDVKLYTDQWKNVAEQLMLVIKENTSSNARLITMLENQERNTIRRSDIEAMIHRHQIEEKRA